LVLWRSSAPTRSRPACRWWPKTFGLAEKLDTEAGLLSHGQKQWLEIGMLLMQDPELLMLDEPIAGMSARERDLTAELLHRIAKNRSVIVIEHDMEFVKRLPTRSL
jgi:urea transport system ATP-binding protein